MYNVGSKTLFNRADWGHAPSGNCQNQDLGNAIWVSNIFLATVLEIFQVLVSLRPGSDLLGSKKFLPQRKRGGGVVTAHLCGYWYYSACIAHALWVVNITGPTIVLVYHTHLFLIVRETHSQLEWTRVLLQYMCRAIVAPLSSDVCLCLNSKRSRSQTLSELQICPQNYEKTNTVLNSLAVLRYCLILEYFLIISQIRRKRVIQCMLAWIFVQWTSRIFEDFENFLRVKGLSHKEIMALAVMVSLWIDTFSLTVDKTCANIQTRLGY